MKLIIAGGRYFNDLDVFETAMASFVGKYGMPDEVVSGKCKTGADAMGEAWAARWGIPVISFPALWAECNNSAGPIRNKKMAEYADEGIVFWDGKSRGSKNMIDELKKLNKPITVIYYSPAEPKPYKLPKGL